MSQAVHRLRSAVGAHPRTLKVSLASGVALSLLAVSGNASAPLRQWLLDGSDTAFQAAVQPGWDHGASASDSRPEAEPVALGFVPGHPVDARLQSDAGLLWIDAASLGLAASGEIAGAADDGDAGGLRFAGLPGGDAMRIGGSGVGSRASLGAATGGSGRAAGANAGLPSAGSGSSRAAQPGAGSQADPGSSGTNGPLGESATTPATAATPPNDGTQTGRNPTETLPPLPDDTLLALAPDDAVLRDLALPPEPIVAGDDRGPGATPGIVPLDAAAASGPAVAAVPAPGTLWLVIALLPLLAWRRLFPASKV
jgi:hypothetical protein